MFLYCVGNILFFDYPYVSENPWKFAIGSLLNILVLFVMSVLAVRMKTLQTSTLLLGMALLILVNFANDSRSFAALLVVAGMCIVVKRIGGGGENFRLSVGQFFLFTFSVFVSIFAVIELYETLVEWGFLGFDALLKYDQQS